MGETDNHEVRPDDVADPPVTLRAIQESVATLHSTFDAIWSKLVRTVRKSSRPLKNLECAQPVRLNRTIDSVPMLHNGLKAISQRHILSMDRVSSLRPVIVSHVY